MFGFGWTNKNWRWVRCRNSASACRRGARDLCGTRYRPTRVERVNGAFLARERREFLREVR